ncbi:MAG: ammonia channel protein, partial [Betaproteobacteria bacterium]
MKSIIRILALAAALLCAPMASTFASAPAATASDAVASAVMAQPGAVLLAQANTSVAPAPVLLAQASAPAAAPAAASAKPSEAAPPTPNKADTAWMMVSTMLVILMCIPGLALFYGGLVRSKNMLSVLMQVFTIFALISVLWAIYGYTLAFGGDGSFYGTFDKLFLKGITPDAIAATF